MRMLRKAEEMTMEGRGAYSRRMHSGGARVAGRHLRAAARREAAVGQAFRFCFFLHERFDGFAPFSHYQVYNMTRTSICHKDHSVITVVLGYNCP